MATRTLSNGGGVWSSTATWVEGAVPTAADDVVPTATSGNLTLDVTPTCRSADFTNGGTVNWGGTLTHNTATNWTIGTSTANPSGVALKFSAAMIYTLGNVASSAIILNDTSGSQLTVDTLGKTFGNVKFNSAGSWLIASPLNTGSGATVTHSAGTVNTDGQNCSWGSYSSNVTTTRHLTLGSSTITLTVGSGTPWNLNMSGMTLSALSATIKFANSASSRTFAGGGGSYGTLNYIGPGSTGALVITGANTFIALLLSDATNARTLTLPASTITTILDAAGIVGTSGKNMTINSSSAGTAATLTEVGLVQTFLTLTDITVNVQGAATGDTTAGADAVSLLALGTLGNVGDTASAADAASDLAATVSGAEAVVGTDTPASVALGGADDPATLADIALVVGLLGVNDPTSITDLATLFTQLTALETAHAVDAVQRAALTAGDAASATDAAALGLVGVGDVAAAIEAVAALFGAFSVLDVARVADKAQPALVADLGRAIRGELAQPIQGQPEPTMTGAAATTIQGQPQW